MVFRTRLSATRRNSSSLRTTVPEAVVGTLKLREGDEVEWEIEVDQNRLFVVFRKAGTASRVHEASSMKRGPQAET